MAEKKNDPTTALVAVMKALEPLVDPDRQWVLQSAANRWGLQVPNAATASSGGAGGEGGGGGTVAGGGGNASAAAQTAIDQKNAREFMRIKRPDTDVQRMACLGYYLVHTTKNAGFSSKEIKQANTDAGGPSNINFTRALDNATRQARYLSNRGPREKQITTLGEDVVLALPDQVAVKELESSQRGRRRKRNAKKKS